MAIQLKFFGTTTLMTAVGERVITAPRQRAVMARLALAPGRSVSADHLLADVWGDDLPSGGARAVAFQITKLRDVLEPDRAGPGSIILTDGAGYRLAIEADAVDVHEFERLVTSAREALDNPNQARDLAGAALETWTGAPFADIDEQTWVSTEVARLDQLRLLAERTSVQARMALGEFLDVIIDLEQLIRQHPFEEGLVADYMTSLDRSGRNVDALRAFGELRVRLGNELGIEPSSALIALERKLLAGESLGDTHGATETSDTLGNLPYIPTRFVGRTEEIARLDDAFSRSPIAVLTGPGGSGKTRTAIEYARRHADSFSDGAWFVELAPLPPGGDVMAVIGETLGLRPGEAADISEVVRRYTRSRKLLLVVDNCEHVVKGAARAISEIVRVARDVSLLVTSRESLGVEGEQLVPLPPLEFATENQADEGTPSPALELLLDRARQAGVEVTELGVLARICIRLEGMPLALELAAARLRTLSPAELEQRLDESLASLSASGKARPERHRTLRAAVAWSHSLLIEPEQTALRRLSTFPSSFDLQAAEAIVPDQTDNEADVLDLIDSLVDKSLVTATKHPGALTRFSLLVPVREFAAEILADEGDSDAVLMRHAVHYAAVVAQAGPQTRGAGYVEAARHLRTEFNNIRLASRTLLEQERPDLLLDLASELQMFSTHTGGQVELVEMLLKAVEALHDTDPERSVRGLWTAARLTADITDPAAAGHARKGLDIAHGTGDLNLIGRMELALSAALRTMPLDTEYLEHLVEARRLLEANPEPYWWEPTWERGLLNLTLASCLPRSDDRIGEHLTIAIDAFVETNDHVLHAATLGEAASLWGYADKDWILDNVRESVRLVSELDAPYWAGRTNFTLGALLMIDGQRADAIPPFEAAAAKFMDCGDIDSWALATGLSADCQLDIGEVDAVQRQLSAVIDTIETLPNAHLHKVRTLDTVASLLVRQGHFATAANILGCALEMESLPETLFDRAPRHAQVLADLEAELGEAMTAEALAKGAELSFDESIRLYNAAMRKLD